MPYSRSVAALLAAALLSSPWTVYSQETPDEPRGSVGAEGEPSKQATDEALAWRQSFPPEQAATYLPEGENVGVIVVAAGEHAQAELAADTLEEALRSSGKFHLVMNDDVLADNSKVGDEKILAKSKHLPVGHVAVVRVYDGAAGKPPTAVVTIYDKDSGEATASTSVTRGTSIGVNKRPTVADEPVEKEHDEQDEQVEPDRASEKALEVARATKDTADKLTDPVRRQYRAKYIWFEDSDGDVLSQWKRVYRGDQKESLRGEAFYNEIGRPDLAEEFGTNRLIKWSTVAGILGVGAGTAALIAVTGEKCSTAADFDACSKSNENRLVGAGAIGAVSFISAVAVGMYYNPHPIELDEARTLANKHNAKLREDLGLPAAPSQEQASRLRWSVGVSPMSDGGAASLRVEF